MTKNSLFKFLALITLMLISVTQASADDTDYDYLLPFTSSVYLSNNNGLISNSNTGSRQSVWNTVWTVGELSNDPFYILMSGNPYGGLTPGTFPYNQSWAIGNPGARIAYYPSMHGANNVYELATSQVPCRVPANNNVWEFDIFLSAAPFFYTRMTGATLAQFGQVRFQIGTEFNFSVVQNTCGPDYTIYNKSQLLASVMLHSTPTAANPNGQTLYYQIIVGGTSQLPPSSPGSPAPMDWFDSNCLGCPQNSFLAVDYVTNHYGGTYVYPGAVALNNLDILPRLLKIIQSGHPYLDSNPAHWYFTDAYFGAANWGGTITTSRWFSPVLKTNGGVFCAGTTKTQYVCEQPIHPNGWINVGGGCYHRPTTVSCQ